MKNSLAISGVILLGIVVTSSLYPLYLDSKQEKDMLAKAKEDCKEQGLNLTIYKNKWGAIIKTQCTKNSTIISGV